MSVRKKFRGTNDRIGGKCLPIPNLSVLTMLFMEQFHPPSSTDGSQRETSRESIFLGAQIMFGDAKAPVNSRIRNISASGMMVDTIKAFAKGVRISATIKGIGEVSGTIAWSTATRIGIHFDEAVDPKLARISVSGDAPVTNYNKPYVPDRRPGLAVR